MFRITAILDRPEKFGSNLFGIPFTGTDEDLDHAKKQCDCFAIAVGQIKSADTRKEIFLRLRAIDAAIPAIVSSSAVLSPHATIGDGTILFHRAVVNAGARVGENGIINTAALVEHDAVVGNHCHISTAAVINGRVLVGDDCFIGSNATVVQGIKIGPGAIVGAGSVVTRDIEAGITVGGVPAKILKQ